MTCAIHMSCKEYPHTGADWLYLFSHECLWIKTLPLYDSTSVLRLLLVRCSVHKPEAEHLWHVHMLNEYVYIEES